MRTLLRLLCRTRFGLTLLILLILLFFVHEACAQGKKYVSGMLIDKTGLPISYATVALRRESDSNISGGAMSDEVGKFNIGPVTDGKYFIYVSNIGYKPVTRYVEVVSEGNNDAGIITLQDTSIMLNELIVTGERIKATSDRGRIIYNITEKMVDASATGTDILKLVPGIHVDIMHNISLEGSSSIVIYVDGRERDKNFINQLNPEEIDKIEVISIPSSEIDGNLTGAINIILKRDRLSGIRGQFLAELPTSREVVYIFPAYKLSYSFKNINLYTSYNGEMTCLNQIEEFSREQWTYSDTLNIETRQVVKQKNHSNRFHYGFDYFLNERNQFNFYAYYNPYSQELDGKASSRLSGSRDSLWQAQKDDYDSNRSSFYSLYYKHSFNNASTITSDLSWYNLHAENTTTYYSQYRWDDIIKENTLKPRQDMLSIKVDYSNLLLEKIDFGAGFKAKLQRSEDRVNVFKYNENIIAFYANIKCKLEKFDLNSGLRAERSLSNLEGSFTWADLNFFPYAEVRYKLTTKQNLLLACNRTIRRPNLNQLNPFNSFDDPWSTTKGNPYLRPEFLTSVYLQHSVQFNGNFLSSRIYFNRANNVINNLMQVNNFGQFQNNFQNLGHMSQIGAQISGSVKFRLLTINPFIKAFSLSTTGNDMARNHLIRDKRRPGIESGLSAIASFKHDLSFSVNIQYKSSMYDIQTRYFSDITYFMTLEKTFRNKFRAGIASAIPFTRNFTYNGSEVNMADFNSIYRGQVLMSRLPVWFRFGSQFNSGKTREINSEKEEVENLRRKGF